MESAASVNIDIAGNLVPFELALAKARQMADLFDREVSKKLGNTGASEAGLSKIAALIEQTNALLAKMTGTVTTADASMNKFAGDAEKAAGAVDDVKSSTAAAAPAVGKLSSEFNSASASIQRAVTANQQFSASNRALAAASNLKLADGTVASTGEMQAYAVALDDVRARYNPLFATIRQYLTLKDELRIATKLGALSDTEASAALSKNRSETLAAIGVLKGHGAASGLATTQMMALTHAARSFAEQIALGVSPLQALTGQMNHLSYVASGPGGVSGAFSAVGTAIAGAGSRLAAFAVGGTAAGTAFAALTVAAVAAGVGILTIRSQAEDALHRTVTFGETAKAFFQTLWDGLRDSSLGTALGVIVDAGINALKKLGSAAVDIAELVVNSFHAAFVDVKTIWAALPDSFALTFTAAANYGIETLNSLVKKSSDAVDQIITIFNQLGAGIPLLNASAQTIPPIDAKPYMDSLDKLVADRNAKIKDIMSSTPIRDFGQQVIDRIQTNHALQGLDALANVDFGKSIGGATGLGNAIGGIGNASSGVTVTIGGMAQQVINVTRAFEDAKRAQLGQLESAQMNLVQMKQTAVELQQTLAAAGQKSVKDVFGSFVSDTQSARSAISDAASEIDNLFKRFDAGHESAKDLGNEIEQLRARLLAMGGDPNSINAFINSLVNGQLQARQLKSNVDNLSQSIRAIPNRTVTITVKTQQIGSGTQSIYDVPNSSGGTSGVGVTRYGGNGTTSGPSITSNEVPRTSGYGSMGGGGDLGSTTVNVTRFATGGVIHPGDTQQVSFFKSPDETVAIFTPQQRAALASPQSGFTGRDPTNDNDRMWTVMMNIEANTRKTAQLLDDIKTSTASGSAFSGSSSGGSSGGADTGQQDTLTQQYLDVLKTVRSNFASAGIVGRGVVGYGGGGLNASPEEIARSIVYGGQSSVGSASGYVNQHGGENYTDPTARARLAAMNPSDPSYAAAYGSVYGFDTGGMIGGGAGDTQKVEFFKNPNEKVIIARPDQFTDARSQPAAANSNASSDRPLIGTLSMPIYLQAGAQVSKDSIAELKRQAVLAVREAVRGINGR